MHPQQPDASPPPQARTPEGAPRATAAVLGAVGLMALAAGLAVSATARWSITFDEPFHILCGYSYLTTGDFRLLPDHPPLAHYLMALPLLPLDLARPFDGDQWDVGDYWALAQRFLSPPNDVEQMTLRARLVVIAVWLAGGWLVWAWSRRLFGAWGAAVSLALYLFHPDLMTHGTLATTDTPASVAFLAALFALTRLVERLTIGRALAFAIAATALVLTKYSALLLAPTFVIVALIVVPRPQHNGAAAPGREGTPPGPAWRAASFAAVAVLTLLISVSAIWAALGFRYRAALDPPSAASYCHMLLHGQVRDPRLVMDEEQRDFLVAEYGRDDLSVIEQYTHQHPTMRALLTTAADARLLPEAWLYGLAGTIFRADKRSAYLLGETSITGWWYYFPIAALLKTPTAILATLVLAAVALRRRLAPRDAPATFFRATLVVIGVFEAVYWLASMTAHLNIGHRHLLPVYPPLFVLCGAVGVWLRSPRILVRAAPAACVLAVVATNLLAWPHYLGYFTELIGGPRHGPKYLSDSNVDWGQDLIYLADFLDAHPRDDVKLSYFGTADPDWYGLTDVTYFEFLADMQLIEKPPAERRLAEFTPGTYIFSLTTLHGTYLEPRFRTWNDALQRDLERHEAALRAALAGESAEGEPAAVAPDAIAARLNQLYYLKLLARLRPRPPDAVIGSSFYLYDLDEEKLVMLLRN